MVGKPWKYDFRTIKVGHYRVFDISTVGSIRQAVYDYGQRHGLRFAVGVHTLGDGRREIRVRRLP